MININLHAYHDLNGSEVNDGKLNNSSNNRWKSDNRYSPLEFSVENSTVLLLFHNGNSNLSCFQTEEKTEYDGINRRSI